MIGSFQDKGILKIIQNGEESMMHYIAVNGHNYSITLGSSDKVDYFKKDKNIKLIFTKEKDKELDALINIIDDNSVVEDLFIRMRDIKFNYFKEYDEDMVILDITLKD